MNLAALGLGFRVQGLGFRPYESGFFGLQSLREGGKKWMDVQRNRRN
jgi:hypothetical protein